jgi:hypothetical protein
MRYVIRFNVTEQYEVSIEAPSPYAAGEQVISCIKNNEFRKDLNIKLDEGDVGHWFIDHVELADRKDSV